MRSFRITAAIAAMARASLPAASVTRVRRSQYAEPIYRGGRSRNSPPESHQGERECARRRRQIAAGSLTESNGLVR